VPSLSRRADQGGKQAVRDRRLTDVTQASGQTDPPDLVLGQAKYFRKRVRERCDTLEMVSEQGGSAR
jgi:hypothetical protein